MRFDLDIREQAHAFLREMARMGVRNIVAIDTQPATWDLNVIDDVISLVIAQ